MTSTSIERWQIFRIGLIALCISGVMGVLAKNLLLHEPDSRTAKAKKEYKFPDTINLKNWEMVKSLSIPPKKKSQPFGHLYEYRRGDKELQIQTRYEVATEGNTSRLLMVYDSIPPATSVINEKYQSGIGYYGSFEYKNKTYITACINPKGETTVTQKQFVNNRYWHTSSVPRFLGWLAGQNDLFDGRCLWTSLSMPVNTFAPPEELKKDRELVEAAWLEWAKWWKQNYPDS
ncbi:MAG: hypothetical protein N5P05_002420 [Chroococcopsis gigantea SAG 12.99]|jgi:cyanosortase A-associated protein|nr:cyanoexosortase A system-associated protein [Chlorogloea purpurea SAG 13.99]MDV3000814.1 hypothetical protein [Chroococcopsis gigantea SAG 12.99]